jgi:6-methylsalicylate decarboxylase
MLRAVVGIDHVVSGTDFPYLRRDLAADAREHIMDGSELTANEKEAVLGSTATKLIPRLAQLAASSAIGAH